MTHTRPCSCLEIKYVWNRSTAALERVPPELRLGSLDEVAGAGADIVVVETPPQCHHRDVLQALRAGAAVVVGVVLDAADTPLVQ